MIRTLGADNRATALKESNTIKAAELLSTEDKYNSEGTELLETLGPQHTVKLAHGRLKEDEEVLARRHVVNSYSEGAPVGETYRLLTKTVSSAENSSKEEFDKRETVTSYSGQGDLGWKLRKPTSVTKDPSGLKLTTTTVYNAMTGSVIETRGPGASGPVPNVLYASSFGTNGTGNGQLKDPWDLTTDASGDIWVADTANNRMEEFTSEGVFERAFGTGGTGNGQFKNPEGVAVDSKGYVWVADTGNNRVQEFNSEGTYIRQFGSTGTGNGQFSELEGLTVDANGDVWVADTGNNRVQVFNSEGTYIRTIGSTGSGNGQFKGPSDVGVNVEGDLYVLDQGNHRIQEFNASMEYIRQFGSEGSGNGQMKSAWRMSISPEGNVWLCDSSDNRVEEFSRMGTFMFQFGSGGSGSGQFKEPDGVSVHGASVYVLDNGNDRVEKLNFISDVYASQFGSEGLGNGQLKSPMDITTDASGDTWVADTANNRVEAFNSEGAFARAFGTLGTGAGQFKSPEGIAVDSSGNVWVSDSGNSRVEVFTKEGTYIRQIGSSGSNNGQFKRPEGLAVDAKGNVWVTDTPDNRVEEFSSEGQYLKTVGAEGTGNGQLKGPSDVGFNMEGNLYVLDKGNHRIQVFRGLSSSAIPTYSSTFGSEGTGNGQVKGPWDMNTDSSGNVWVADTANNRVEEFSSKGVFVRAFGTSGTGNNEFKSPEGVTVSKGDVWVADSGNNRVEEFTIEGAYLRQFGSAGTGSGQFKEPEGLTADSKGDVWVADVGNNRVQEFSPEGAYLKTLGSEGTGNGQFKGPSDVGFNAEGDLYVLDHNNHRIQEFNTAYEYLRQFGSEGSGNGQMKTAWRMSVGPEGNVWLADSSDSRVEEFSPSGEYLIQLGTEGTGSGQFKSTDGVSVYGSNLYVLDHGNDRVEEFSFLTGEYVRQFGSEGSGSGQMKTAWRMSVGPEGNVWLADSSDNRVEEFTGNGSYVNQFGSEGSGSGQFKTTDGVSVRGSEVHVLDHGNGRVEEWTTAGSGSGESAHDNRVIYYSSVATPEYPTCGGHPEWANLVCETFRAVQPGSSGLPELPTTTTTYNMLDEVEVTTEKFGEKAGAATRTKTETYDAAGRPLTSETTSTAAEDHALPKVTNEYSEQTGALVKQSTTEGSKTESITSTYNKLGQLESYADAAGNVAKYVYDEDGRVKEASEGKAGEAEAIQTYTYNETTGALTEAVNSQGPNLLKFTASYDTAGRMTSETYPNAMTSDYTYNPVGEATSLEYVKTADCKATCNEVWLKDAIVPSIYGQMLSQSSTLSSENYSYDAAGRLTETQETPAGKGCEVRLYAYDEESNRLSLTTRSPGSEGKCATSGGGVQSHTYDEANRLNDSGVAYDALDNITKLPASDAGKEEGELASKFYVDNQVERQSQHEETIKYFYDPTGRTVETESEGKTAAKITSHYNGPSEIPSWTTEGSEKWSRNIPGIDGSLTAIQKSGQAPVLQLHDLRGDIVGTAAASETTTELLSTYNSTEFGVPTTNNPPPYSWLGAGGVASELPSGVSTQGGASYVPQVARELQVETPIPPGAFPNGEGSGAPYVTTLSALAIESGNYAAANTLAAAVAAREAAAAEAAAREAEEKAMEGAGEGEEEGGGESIEITVPTNLVIVGSGSAHAASSGEIICESKVDYPHNSKHKPGTVNVEATLECSDSWVLMYIRVVVFYEHRKASEGDEVGFDEKEISANAATKCKTGYYQGWAEFFAQGIKSNPDRLLKWGVSRYVKC